MPNSTTRDKDLNDLTRSVLYEEVPNQDLVRLTIITIGIGFLLFIVWAAITQVNEVAKTSGEIIPSGYAQIVQHLEGGIIKDILVEEGDLVEEGQVLVLMGGIGAEQDFSSLNKQQTAHRLQAERLNALANNTDPDFESIAGDDPDAILYQQNLLLSARKAYEAERQVLEKQRAQKQETIERLHSEKLAAEKDLAAALKILEMKQALEKKGASSRKDLIDSERDVAKAEGEVSAFNSEIAEAEQALDEYANRLQTLEIKTRDETLKKLEAVKTHIAQNREMLDKLKERVDRQNVRAPVRGLIKGLRVNTIGGVIGAGQPIMEIIPLDHSLIVEARIPPREIGNLKTGQISRVKVSAYEFSRYGIIEGVLEFISATTFVDEQGKTYYKGRIRLKQDYVGKDPERNLILPGMTIQADIITGQKSILAYLLKPIHKSLDTAFTEK